MRRRGKRRRMEERREQRRYSIQTDFSFFFYLVRLIKDENEYIYKIEAVRENFSKKYEYFIRQSVVYSRLYFKFISFSFKMDISIFYFSMENGFYSKNYCIAIIKIYQSMDDKIFPFSKYSSHFPRDHYQDAKILSRLQI